MPNDTILELIRTRRTVRKFTGQPVDEAAVESVLEAGRWAPSGMNNQPWRFVVVRGEEAKQRVAEQTKYGRMVMSADVLIPVFVHKPSMYNQTKDHQAIGACLQNMLLMAHGLGLGAVWLGEILKNAEAVRAALGVGEDLELMAVVLLGHPAVDPPAPGRAELDELVIARL